jgi:hypothetical protein
VCSCCVRRCSSASTLLWCWCINSQSRAHAMLCRHPRSNHNEIATQGLQCTSTALMFGAHLSPSALHVRQPSWFCTQAAAAPAVAGRNPQL